MLIPAALLPGAARHPARKTLHPSSVLPPMQKGSGKSRSLSPIYVRRQPKDTSSPGCLLPFGCICTVHPAFAAMPRPINISKMWVNGDYTTFALFVNQKLVSVFRPPDPRQGCAAASCPASAVLLRSPARAAPPEGYRSPLPPPSLWLHSLGRHISTGSPG